MSLALLVHLPVLFPNPVERRSRPKETDGRADTTSSAAPTTSTFSELLHSTLPSSRLPLVRVI